MEGVAIGDEAERGAAADAAVVEVGVEGKR